MSKKIICFLAAITITASMVGCGNTDDKSKEPREKSTIEQRTEKLEGKWSKDYSFKELKELNRKLINDIKEKTTYYGLEYKEDIQIVEGKKTKDGIRYEEESIRFDNDTVEYGRLESLDYSFRIYGEKQNEGQIVFRTSLKLNGPEIVKGGEFDFGETSLAKYAELMTGVENRDYTDLNKKIIGVLMSKDGEGIIESSINGLYEEFTVSQGYLVYKLQTKRYDFSKVTETEGLDLDKKGNNDTTTNS